MSDCEWMFADAASGPVGFKELAHLNPLRWTGAISFEKAIHDLEEVLKKGSRPILAKVPAGVSTTAQHFETIEQAIAYLKKKDPAELVRKQDAERNANVAVTMASTNKDAAEAAVAAANEDATTKEELVMQAKAGTKAANDAANAAKLSADTVESEFDCEWMFGDVGLEVMGFRAAKLNPVRWSGNLSITEGLLQLQAVQAEDADREIVVKVPGGITGTEQHFKNACNAIAYLEGVCPLRNKARDALKAAHSEQKTAEARLRDAEADAAEAEAKLQSARAQASRAEASLEDATKKAVQAKAEVDELSSHH
mmetsp:Transcript_63281/g.125114  ORF Transcript_63281/g.125114 Transcript_63281/m.125114 type:complete len:310 (-) Transcript_63281:173-1102(-)